MNRLLGVLSIFLAATAQATLIDRGEGFIYDDVLDVTWAQNANINGGPMTWDQAVAWVDGYSQTHSVYGPVHELPVQLLLVRYGVRAHCRQRMGLRF